MATSLSSTAEFRSVRPPLGGTAMLNGKPESHPMQASQRSRGWEEEVTDPAGSDVPVLLVIAHPDDETVGVGGLLPRLRKAELLCVTDGSPASLADARRAGCATRPQYAALRADELRRAAAAGGIPAERIGMLGVTDQAASLRMGQIARQLVQQIVARRPSLLITHPYEGGHPDHDATAWAVHAARQLLQSRSLPCPDVLEMASYHGAGGRLSTGAFLPHDGCLQWTVELTPEEQRAKRKMMACHASQQRVLAQFGVERESLRLAPAYDFAQPPHPGRLWYERFNWGTTGSQWRSRAVAALDELAPCSGAA